MNWGITELSEDEVQRGKWLIKEEGRVKQKGMLSQSTLKPWSKTKLMAREIILDLSDEIVEGKKAPIAPDELVEEQEEQVDSKEEPGGEKPSPMPPQEREEESQVRERGIKKIIQQDIRDMIKRKKINAEQVKEGKRKEQLENEELVTIAREMESEQKKEEERTKRIQRAQWQKETLLEDIRKKTEEARLRMSIRRNEVKLRDLEREKRLNRAGAQKRKTLEDLEKMHMMDWDEIESREEGGGKVIEVRKESTLICASSAEGERKRKRGKKLRWTGNAKWRAAEKGKVRRKYRRAARRLPIEEVMQWLDSEAGDEQGLLGLGEKFGELLIGKSYEMDPAAGEVAELLADLQLDGVGAKGMAWEVGEHGLLDNILSTGGYEIDKNSKNWFTFDEERQEHTRLDMMMTQVHMDGDEPEPTQGETSGSRCTAQSWTIILPDKSIWQPCASCKEIVDNLTPNSNLPSDTIKLRTIHDWTSMTTS